jgi:hypothetical protein
MSERIRVFWSPEADREGLYWTYNPLRAPGSEG